MLGIGGGYTNSNEGSFVLSYTETVMDNNEERYPPPPQGISNVFAVAYVSYRSSSDSAKYTNVHGPRRK